MVIFGILRLPIFHPKKIEGPPFLLHPPPPSNLNYDWSLIIDTDVENLYLDIGAWMVRHGSKSESFKVSEAHFYPNFPFPGGFLQ